MLSGLRWPGQTDIGSWPPATIELKMETDMSKFYIFTAVTQTHTLEVGKPEGET